MPNDIQWWWQNFGPSGVMAFLAFWGGRSVWKFAKPYLHSIATEHITLIRQAKITLETMPLKEEIATKTEIISLGKDLQDIKLKQKSDGEMICEIHKKVIKVPSKNHLCPPPNTNQS